MASLIKYEEATAALSARKQLKRELKHDCRDKSNGKKKWLVTALEEGKKWTNSSERLGDA